DGDLLGRHRPSDRPVPRRRAARRRLAGRCGRLPVDVQPMRRGDAAGAGGLMAVGPGTPEASIQVFNYAGTERRPRCITSQTPERLNTRIPEHLNLKMLRFRPFAPGKILAEGRKTVLRE